MLLSEAILEGCKTTKPWTEEYVDSTENPTCACALGAALIGAGIGLTVTNITSFETLVDRTFGNNIHNDFKHKHPVKGYNTSLAAIIVNLNDEEHWSRERIAAWLKGIGY